MEHYPTWSLLAFESRHADPNFVTLVALASFLFFFVVVVVANTSFFVMDSDGYRYTKKGVMTKVVVVLVVLAVPFGGYLYANVKAIKKDRAAEQSLIRDNVAKEIQRLAKQSIPAKTEECVESNGLAPFGAIKSTEYWCKYSLEIGGYEQDISDCMLQTPLIYQSAASGPFGRSWDDFFENNETSIQVCLDASAYLSDSMTYLEFYLDLLFADPCYRTQEEKLVWLGVDSCERVPDYSTPTFPSIPYPTNAPVATNAPVDDRDGYDKQDDYDQEFQDEYSGDYEPCDGDCNDMDNDGYTWDDYDADGDGLYESWP